MNDYKINEEFQFGKIRLRVEKCKNPLNCENCFFEKFREHCHELSKVIGACSSICREDEQSVKFVEIKEDEKH